MADVKREKRPTLSRRRFLGGALGAAAAAPAVARRAGAQAKPTITYWNGLTGADGKVMDGLIEQFTNETGIKMEQQRILWPDLYAKLQVSVPAGEGPDLCLIHTVEVPHFASDGILDPMDPGPLAAKGFKEEDYLASPWQGGVYQGKRYTVPLDVPQHLFYMNMKVMKDAGLVGPDGQPKVPASGAELVAMAKQITKGDTFGFAIGSGTSAQVHLGLPSHALAERRERLRAGPQALGAQRAGGDRGGRVLGIVLRPAQGGAARERERARRVHRRQARHVAGRVLERRRPPRGQGGLRRWRPCRVS